MNRQDNQQPLLLPADYTNLADFRGDSSGSGPSAGAMASGVMFNTNFDTMINQTQGQSTKKGSKNSYEETK